MNSRIVALAAMALCMGAIQVLGAPVAWACDPVPLFVIEPDDLTAPDFGVSASDLSRSYDEFWDADRGLAILGGYVIETSHTLEPVEQWTRGSVSAVVRTWGEAPADTGPFLHRTVDLATTAQDSCGEPGDGPALGSRTVRLITDLGDDSWRAEYRYVTPEAAEAALTAAFGEPEVVDRDAAAEELMIARLGNTRSGSGTGIALAFGFILVVGGVLAYQYRKKKLFWQWEQIQAELAAEEQELQPIGSARSTETAELNVPAKRPAADPLGPQE